jgi:hypothetical protein
MTNKCPICGKNHDDENDPASDERMERANSAASDILTSLVRYDFTPPDVTYIMATIASSIAASEGPREELDQRIETFVTTFTEMAKKKRFAVVDLAQCLTVSRRYLHNGNEAEGKNRSPQERQDGN